MAPSPKLIVAALILVQVLFGIHFVASKALVHFFPPLLWASLRAGIAAALLVGLAVALRRPHPKGGMKFFLPLAGFACLGVIINQACFLIGLKYTTPANSSVLNTMIPVFTLLIVILRGMEELSWKRLAGFFSAFLGVLILVRVETFTMNLATAKGDLLTLVNALSYGCYLAFSKRFIEQHDRVWVTAWLFLFGTVGLGLAALPDWMSFTWPTLTPSIVGAGIYAVLGGTVMTYFLVTWTLAYTPASQVGLFIYIQPVAASLVAWIAFGLSPTPRTLLGSVFIFAGLYLTQLRTRRRRSSDKEAPASNAA